MSTISSSEVTHLAQLARLRLDEKALVDATKKLNNILEFFSTIQAINTDGVPVADDVSGLQNVTRADAVEEPLCTPADLLARAPQQLRGHIQVQAVFE